MEAICGLRVDEPARDAGGAVAADLALAGGEDAHAVHPHPPATALGGQEGDVGLAEDDEQIGIHARLEHGDTAELAELRGVRLVVEGASDERVEAGAPPRARRPPGPAG